MGLNDPFRQAPDTVTSLIVEHGLNPRRSAHSWLTTVYTRPDLDPLRPLCRHDCPTRDRGRLRTSMSSPTVLSFGDVSPGLRYAFLRPALAAERSRLRAASARRRAASISRRCLDENFRISAAVLACSTCVHCVLKLRDIGGLSRAIRARSARISLFDKCTLSAASRARQQAPLMSRQPAPRASRRAARRARVARALKSQL